jgi:O-antigen/teichoic acid export membrane protein
MNEADATFWQLLGAAGFGAVVGWYLYYVNRYRKDDIKLADVVTLIGAIGGAAIMTLFPAKTDLFGAYGIGLAVGFFAYFLVLLVMVRISDKFAVEWFLDGRRKKLEKDETREGARDTVAPMEDEGGITG